VSLFSFVSNLLGLISPTCLRAAFTPAAPKSVRIQSSCQYLFTLLKSTSVKAARKMLVKLIPLSYLLYLSLSISSSFSIRLSQAFFLFTSLCIIFVCLPFLLYLSFYIHIHVYIYIYISYHIHLFISRSLPSPLFCLWYILLENRSDISILSVTFTNFLVHQKQFVCI